MDILAKCLRYHEAAAARAHGIYPYYHAHASAPGPEVIIDGRRMLSFASNDYLGLAAHPEVRAASVRAIEQFGTGCGASRLLAGTLTLHEQLEHELAAFFGTQAALVFTTGMQANWGVMTALAGKGDVVLIDKLSHASIIDGSLLSHATVRRFPHNVVAALERMLARREGARGVLIAIEGVYSMEGDVAPLPAMLELAQRHGARVMLDDAHGIGVLGARGAGTADYLNCLAATDIIVGRFSKTLAAVGGFVAADRAVIEYLKHHARSLIFSAALPAAQAAAAQAALAIVRREPERRARLMAHAQMLRDGLRAAGFDTGNSCTPIVPLITGARDGWRAMAGVVSRGYFHQPGGLTRSAARPRHVAPGRHGGAHTRASRAADRRLSQRRARPRHDLIHRAPSKTR